MFHVEQHKTMQNKKQYLRVKDYAVSGETFELLYNHKFNMLETFPVPNADSLGRYYKSESYISHSNTKRNTFEKAYHFVRSIMVKRKLRLLQKHHPKQGNLLDIGCGTGTFLEAALKANYTITGIEPNEKARAIANKKCNNQVYDQEKINQLPQHSFDVVTMWHVLEHIPNPEKHLETVKKLLKPQGVLFVAVPNFKSYDATFYKQFWAAYDVPRHLWHFSQMAIHKLAEKTNMKVVATQPMLFDSFYVSLLSEKYKNGKMNIFRAFYIGLLSNTKAMQTKEYSSLIYVIKKNNT